MKSNMTLLSLPKPNADSGQRSLPMEPNQMLPGNHLGSTLGSHYEDLALELEPICLKRLSWLSQGCQREC